MQNVRWGCHLLNTMPHPGLQVSPCKWRSGASGRACGKGVAASSGPPGTPGVAPRNLWVHPEPLGITHSPSDIIQSPSGTTWSPSGPPGALRDQQSPWGPTGTPRSEDHPKPLRTQTAVAPRGVISGSMPSDTFQAPWGMVTPLPPGTGFPDPVRPKECGSPLSSWRGMRAQVPQAWILRSGVSLGL